MGIDFFCMQSEWYDQYHFTKSMGLIEYRVPQNCQFIIDDLTMPEWYLPYRHADLICIEGVGGDYRLLMNLLNGAYRYVLQLNDVYSC